MSNLYNQQYWAGGEHMQHPDFGSPKDMAENNFLVARSQAPAWEWVF